MLTGGCRTLAAGRRDGARGMAALKIRGAYTLCQDEETCVVFGMPRAALALGHMRLKLVGRQGRSRHPLERLCCARRQQMDHLGNLVHACPGRTFDQHRFVQSRQLPHGGAQGLCSLGFAIDHPLGHVAADHDRL